MKHFILSLFFALTTLILSAEGIVAPKPLYVDPTYDGAADPIIVQNRDNGLWYMFYTNRRATITDEPGVCWVHGTPIGIATSSDRAHWTYLQDAHIGFAPNERPTYWAPSVIDDGKSYHMYLTYVPGVFEDWNHTRDIIHLVSSNLLDWTYVSTLKLESDHVIDADVMQMPDGTWRMWYNNEIGGKRIAYADSPDLYHWTDHGSIPGMSRCEGPNAFFWKGHYWLIVDEWHGFGVYRSEDAQNWTKQPSVILGVPGHGPQDGVSGNHCDVIVSGDHAYIYYFTHPGRALQDHPDDHVTRRSVIQVAELSLGADGWLTCDRDADCVIE